MYRSLCTYKSFDCAAHLGKIYVNAIQFRSVFKKKKQRRVELKSVGNFVA